MTASTPTCPYCGEGIEEIDEKQCSACNVPHHIDCWEENQGCTGYGCDEAPVHEYRQPDESQERHVPYAGGMNPRTRLTKPRILRGITFFILFCMCVFEKRNLAVWISCLVGFFHLCRVGKRNKTGDSEGVDRAVKLSVGWFLYAAFLSLVSGILIDG